MDAIVLLVDDEQPLRLVYRTNLEASGFSVIEAEDEPTALELAAHGQPHVAMLDILLPGSSGWSIAAELARRKETAHIAIVFLSALTPDTEHMRALESIGVPYFEKPLLNPTRLPELLQEIIESEHTVDRDHRRHVLEQLARRT